KVEQSLSQIKQTPEPQHVAQCQLRPDIMYSKNSYKIPYEKIRTVLEVASKPALQEVQKQWAAFLEQLKGADAPAHATIQDSKPAAASDEALVVAFRYEIHCSLFLDNRVKIESMLARTIGKQLTIIPIPGGDWQQLRSEYVNRQEVKPAEQAENKSDPFIEKARDLVGDDLLHIHD